MNPQSEPVIQHQEPALPRTRRCRHIHAAGQQCGSPCLRTEQFCYFHHTTRRPVSDPRTRRARVTTYDLPVPEDRDSIRAAVAQVMHDIANKHIDPRRAGLILYSLQIALCALPKEPRMTARSVAISAAARPATRRNSHRNSKPINEIPAEPIVEEAVLDEDYGLIAPETFLEPEQAEEEEEDPGDEVLEDGRLLRNTLGYKLLKDVELYESRTQGWYRGRVDAFEEATKAAAAAAGCGSTMAELTETLATAAAKALAEQAAFTAQVAAGMAKYSIYTGRDDNEVAEDAPAPELEPWDSPVLPNLNASAEGSPTLASKRHPELTKRHLELSECHPELTKRHLELSECHPELTKRHPELTKCHPERSLARTCAKRSRRICGPLTPPKPPAPFGPGTPGLYRTAPAIASSN